MVALVVWVVVISMVLGWVVNAGCDGAFERGPRHHQAPRTMPRQPLSANEKGYGAVMAIGLLIVAILYALGGFAR